jgi:hypothetical protein
MLVKNKVYCVIYSEIASYTTPKDLSVRLTRGSSFCKLYSYGSSGGEFLQTAQERFQLPLLLGNVVAIALGFATYHMGPEATNDTTRVNIVSTLGVGLTW